MKSYQAPKWEITLFLAEDAIRTSSLVDDEDCWTNIY